MCSEDSIFREGPGRLLFAQIENHLAKATVCLQGAQLTHWQPRSQAEPVTFMSATVQYTEGKSIRAGVPICWPWFGPHATDKARASHGFARNVLWEARAPVCLERRRRPSVSRTWEPPRQRGAGGGNSCASKAQMPATTP